MSRARWHLLVDVLMAISGFALLQTGLLLYFVLPAHSRADAVLGLTRHDWGEVHFYLAMSLLVLLLVHLTLNWNWVCGVVVKLFITPAGKLGRGRMAAGIAALLLLLGMTVGLLWMAQNIKTTTSPERGGGWRQRDQLRSSQNIQPADSHALATDSSQRLF